jgi:hypothetical protein
LFDDYSEILAFYLLNSLPLELEAWHGFVNKMSVLEARSRELQMPTAYSLPIGNGVSVSTKHVPQAMDVVNNGKGFSIVNRCGSQLTMNGVAEYRQELKHADELSFTFSYLGNSIVLDSGTNTINTDAAESLKTAEAHSGIFAADENYFVDLFQFNSVIENGENHIAIYSKNTGYANMAISRKIIWIFPNALVIIDNCNGYDKKEHDFTQNYIFNKFSEISIFSDGFIANVKNTDVKVELIQLADGFDDFKIYSGDKNARGAICFDGINMQPIDNFAFIKRADSCRFVTLILFEEAAAPTDRFISYETEIRDEFEFINLKSAIAQCVVKITKNDEVFIDSQSIQMPKFS